jgi:hypothetical protein
VTLIVYRDEIVASAGARRLYLAPRIASLDDGDPLVLSVSLTGTYAMRVRHGAAPGPYTHDRAERFARCAMIDDDEFRVLDTNRLDDRLIAGHFGVPVEQVSDKRRDLRRLD